VNRSSLIARNTVFLLISRIAMALSSLFLFAQAGRMLGVAGFGILTLALTFARIFYVVADFGAGYLIVREVARDEAKAGRFLLSGLVAKVVPILVGFFALALISHLLYNDTETVRAILIAGLSATLDALGNFFRAFFNAFEKMHFTSALLSLQSLIILGVCSLLLQLGYSVSALLTVYCLVYLLGALVALIVLLTGFHLIPTWDLTLTKTFFRQSMPFVSFLAFGILYSQLDSILLSVLAPTKEIAVGIYQASFKLITSLDYLPDMLTRAIYPAVSRAYKQSREYAVAVSEQVLKYLVLLSVPIAVGIFLLAKDVVVFVYGVDFASSASVMRILAWVIPLRYAGFVFGICLSATDHQRYRAITTGVVLVLNSVLNLILIPRFGYLGASVVNLGSISAIFVMYYFFSGRHFSALNFTHYLRYSLVASLIMGVCIWLLQRFGFPFLVLVPIGVGLYLIMLNLTGAIERQDYRALSRLVRGMVKSASH
jgi:O-antigen/teichoic acid export membrane protein